MVRGMTSTILALSLVHSCWGQDPGLIVISPEVEVYQNITLTCARFNPSATRVLLVTGRELIVWDIAKQELINRFSLGLLDNRTDPEVFHWGVAKSVGTGAVLLTRQRITANRPSLERVRIFLLDERVWDPGPPVVTAGWEVDGKATTHPTFYPELGQVVYGKGKGKDNFIESICVTSGETSELTANSLRTSGRVSAIWSRGANRFDCVTEIWNHKGYEVVSLVVEQERIRRANSQPSRKLNLPAFSFFSCHQPDQAIVAGRAGVSVVTQSTEIQLFSHRNAKLLGQVVSGSKATIAAFTYQDQSDDKTKYFSSREANGRFFSGSFVIPNAKELLTCLSDDGHLLVSVATLDDDQSRRFHLRDFSSQLLVPQESSNSKVGFP